MNAIELLKQRIVETELNTKERVILHFVNETRYKLCRQAENEGKSFSELSFEEGFDVAMFYVKKIIIEMGIEELQKASEKE